MRLRSLAIGLCSVSRSVFWFGFVIRDLCLLTVVYVCEFVCIGGLAFS